MNTPCDRHEDRAPGFFGKVLTHGDFVSRRLPPMLLDAWDGWLQAAMRASRDSLGPRWLDTYLNSPVWRFVLAPGVCGERAWAGVLMPSVDRVGRYFPLTIACGAAGGALLDWIDSGHAWFGRIEELALSSLRDDFVLESFDAALLAGPALADHPAPGSRGPHGARLPLSGIDGGLARQLARAALDGRSIWWTEGSAAVEPSLLVCQGLPQPAAFAGMLAGNWRQSGWA
ncbi:putative uncharacterized protein [Janthinobacterium agaricidamnosum NBRC 102515 = DSM 9628]|uniref:Type VI secretion-associated protein n=2 Tax=Janthinobacterium agaricidamnosum TaxID=55508 RepID=W0VEV9_9BURK|nr:putative uncharacterized protein [Janthinobacterium agaricidamnosum NBRC 102515 = DSM 9628]